MSKSDGPCGCDATPAADAGVQNPSDTTGQWVSVYAVPKMDCPSEERMIRLALSGLDGIRKLTFDLSDRRLEVMHGGVVEPITKKLATLGLGATLQENRRRRPRDDQSRWEFGRHYTGIPLPTLTVRHQRLHVRG